MFRITNDSLLQNKNFLRLFLSQAFSQTGISFLNFVLTISAFEVVKISTQVYGWHISNNQAVSIIIASYGLASFIFGIPAGILVDYLNRKYTMFYSSLFRFALVLLLVYFSHSLVGLVIFTFVLNSISQFFYPAEAAILPRIVKAEKLVLANSIYNITYFLSQIIGFLIGGVVLYRYGFVNTIYIIASFFVIAAISVSFINVNEDKHSLSNVFTGLFKLVINGFQEAIRYIRANKDTKISLYYLGVLQIMIGIFWALQPGLSVEVLDIKIQSSAIYIIIPIIVGMLVGAIIINKSLNKLKESFFVESAIVISTLSFIGIYLLDFEFTFPKRIPLRFIFDGYNRIRFLPDLNILTLAVVLMFFIGIASSFLFIIYNTKLQLSTKDGVRGRIYGILQSLVTVSGAVPVLLSGYIADKFGIKDVFLAVALFLVVFHFLLKYRYKI